MRRKLVSLFLACALAVCTAPCALAGTPDTSPSEICVIVPTDSWVVVNPYGLPVSRDGVSSADRVVSPVQMLQNCGTVPVWVEVSAVGVLPPESGINLVSEVPSGTGRDVFMFLEFQSEPEDFAGEFTDGPNQLLVTQLGTIKQDVLFLEPGQEAYFHFSGATSTPSELWCAEDTVDVALTFTFTPVIESDAVQAAEVVETPEEAEVPAEPSEPPAEPVETPEEPAETPVEPAETPVESVETPEESIETPETPAETPAESVETTEEPVETPEEPTEPPEAPAETPEEPVETPEEPVVIV